MQDAGGAIPLPRFLSPAHAPTEVAMRVEDILDAKVELIIIRALPINS